MGDKAEDERRRTSSVKLAEKQGWMKNDTPPNKDRPSWPALGGGSGGGVAAISRARV